MIIKENISQSDDFHHPAFTETLSLHFQPQFPPEIGLSDQAQFTNNDNFISLQNESKTARRAPKEQLFSLFQGAKSLTGEFERVIFEERLNQAQQIEQLGQRLAFAGSSEASLRAKVGELKLAKIDALNEKEALMAVLASAKRRYHLSKILFDFEKEAKTKGLEFLEKRLSCENRVFEGFKIFHEELSQREVANINSLFFSSIESSAASIKSLGLKIAAKESELKDKEESCNNFPSESGQLVLKLQKLKQIELFRFQSQKDQFERLSDSRQAILESLSLRINQGVALYTESQTEVETETSAIDLEVIKLTQSLNQIKGEIGKQRSLNERTSQEILALEMNLNQLETEGVELQRKIEGKEAGNILDIEETGIQGIEVLDRKEKEVKDLDDQIALLEEKIWRMRNFRNEQIRTKKELNDELKNALAEEFENILKR